TSRTQIRPEEVRRCGLSASLSSSAWMTEEIAGEVADPKALMHCARGAHRAWKRVRHPLCAPARCRELLHGARAGERQQSPGHALLDRPFEFADAACLRLQARRKLPVPRAPCRMDPRARRAVARP